MIEDYQTAFEIYGREELGPGLSDVFMGRANASLGEYIKTHMGLRDVVLDYYNDAGELQREYFTNEEKAQARADELREQGFGVAQEYARDYYAELLRVQDSSNDAMIQSDVQLYNHLLNAQNEFANAREELFFGQRSNFTGQLYKQVVQGGVESLLHHVEIVQTNNFHGYNTDEMVEAVTSRVLDEVRRATSSPI